MELLNDIELIENLMYKEPSGVVGDGINCINLVLNVMVTGNNDLISCLDGK